MSDPAPGVLLREPDLEISSAAGVPVPLVVQPEWRDRFPWIIQGTSGRGEATPFDLGLAGTQPVGPALSRWWALHDALRATSVVLARQVHGRDLLDHDALAPGLHLAPPADGHRTARPGVLLAVTVADCVPVFLVRTEPRAIALLHAGWRGVAAGILEAGIAALLRDGGGADRLHVHAGPSICGACYEVGPEVHAALGLAVPASRTTVDLRAELARRAARAGIPDAAISRSSWCTRCDRSRFFSHRGGDAGRQVGVLGIRASA